ncbi:tyrosine-type recombinase/integrase [Streptomyces sp. NPDC001276]|uniref:tyrosine-type recombinase/integrase n=1 Tax=Streptomyces sp. NPDC001276 TaxID=3364555 RepID=UPI003692A552
MRERLGLEVRFHDLRHTCVTLLLGLGVPPHIVRDIVGHGALDVTMNIYAHVDMTEKRAALDRLGVCWQASDGAVAVRDTKRPGGEIPSGAFLLVTGGAPGRTRTCGQALRREIVASAQLSV